MKKSTIRNKLDKICSEIVRKRGKCEHCNSKKNLQCCHVFSRTYNNTRWGLDNLLCLCASCHFWAHKNPILFGEYVRQYLGSIKYDLLKEKHNLITKYTTGDLQIKYQVLKTLLEGQINGG